MDSKEELSGQGWEELSSRRQSQSGSGQPQVYRPEWRPMRLGYHERQWTHRPRTEFENDLHREAFRKQQPYQSTIMDFGRDGKIPQEYLTENGLKLLKVLALGDRDMKVLAWYAEEGSFDLKAALNELREYELLDESDSEMIGLVKKRL